MTLSCKEHSLPFGASQLCLAAPGAPGFAKHHQQRLYSNQETSQPTVAPGRQAAQSSQGSATGTSGARHSSLQDFSALFRTLPQPLEGGLACA